MGMQEEGLTWASSRRDRSGLKRCRHWICPVKRRPVLLDLPISESQVAPTRQPVFPSLAALEIRPGDLALVEKSLTSQLAVVVCPRSRFCGQVASLSLLVTADFSDRKSTRL